MPGPPPPPSSGGAPFPVGVKLAAPWRETLASDATENQFLIALREQPADESTRMVYADWLEQRGRTDEAGFVRHAGDLPPDDPRAKAGSVEWRRITSRAAIALCEREGCPGRWDLLTVERHAEDFRHCAVCIGPSPRYVASFDDARHAGGGAGCPIAIDADANADELVEHYRLWRKRAQDGLTLGAPRLPEP